MKFTDFEQAVRTFNNLHFRRSASIMAISSILGRLPKISGTSEGTLHAVNNRFYDNGHAFNLDRTICPSHHK
jgi:hypothetical protein